MVLPAKIFELKGDIDLDCVAGRLEGYREVSPHRLGEEETISLLTEVLDLDFSEDVVSGVLSKDFVRSHRFRREVEEAPFTEEAPFWIKRFQGRLFLIVAAPSVARGAKKLLTGHVASSLSEAVFQGSWAIVEAELPHGALRELHERNPEATRLIWFDDVDITNVDKLCLSGSGLADTALYNRYLEHGKIWYAVFRAQGRGMVVGVTRSCVVTLFSKSTTEDLLEYVFNDFLPLID